MSFFRIKLPRLSVYSLLTLLVLLLSTSRMISQDNSKYRIYGRILDSLNQKALPGATVSEKNSKLVSVSDSDGNYELKLPQGSHEIICSFLGFKKETIILNVQSDLLINFSLAPEPVNVNTVIVNAHSGEKQFKSIQPGTLELSQNNISYLPGLLGESDFYKTFELLPGVLANGEGDASMYVRGGGPDQNLILLDGATVYNPTHLLGFYSVFITDVIGDVTLIKAGMPAEYGNRISSVVDFKSNFTIPDSLAISGNIGLLSSRIHLATPIFKHRGMIYLAARKTYINTLLSGFRSLRLIRKSSILYSSSYDFYDLNGGIEFNLTGKDRLYLSSYLGKDVFDLKSRVLEMQSGMDWGNKTISFNWNHIFNENFYMDNRLSYSGYNFNMDLSQSQYIFNLRSGIKDLSYKGRFSWNLANNRIRAGWEFVNHAISPNTSSALSDSTSLNLGSTDVYNSNEISGFVSDELKLNENLSMVLGLRYNSYFHIGPFKNYPRNELGEIIDTIYYKSGKIIDHYNGLEPRLSLRWLVSKSASIKLAYTLNNQYVNLINSASVAFPTDFWVSSSKYIKPQQGNQFTLGFYKSFLNFETSMDLYYKTSTNQIEFKKGIFSSIYNAPIEENLVFGNGRAYGIEFLFKKQIGKINGWIGYTISSSEKSFSEIENGRWFPAKYDRRHDLCAVANYDFSSKWEFSAVFVFATGNAYTPVVGRYFIANNVINEYGSYNSARTPPYNRLDIAATYTLKKTGKLDSRLVFSVYNVYNRHNVFFIYPQATGNLEKFTLNIEPREVSIFPILPSISWQLSF